MRMAIGASLALLAPLAGAQEDSPGSVSLGYVGTTGNTETQTFNVEVLYTLPFERWVHNFKFQGLGSVEDSVTRAERYYLEEKSDFTLSSDDYLFAKGSWTDDRFSGFDYQATVSAGYGHYFYDNESFTLEGFTGAGYRENRVVDADSQGEVIFTLGENLRWDLSEATHLTQSLVSEIGEELTVTRFEIGLVSNIIGQIATKIAFQARNISEVPAGTENTDTQTSVSLVYEF